MRKSAALILAGGLATAAVTAIPEAEAQPVGLGRRLGRPACGLLWRGWIFPARLALGRRWRGCSRACRVSNRRSDR